MSEKLLEVRDLRVYFGSRERPVRAVDGVSFDMREGETVALVGESGCGKSVTAMALSRLVPEPPGFYAGGEVLYRDQHVLQLDERSLRDIRGNEISYIFQDPGASLNPVFRIGYQIREAIHLHRPDDDAEHEVLELMQMVGMSDPQRATRAYPHELSGGMQQRAMIAMALACRPRVLIADEPTTALDVTIQAQILELLVKLQAELGMAMLLITHNLGLVAGVAHRINVMYAGRIVEAGETVDVLTRPRHPYTAGLLKAVPRLQGGDERLVGLEGTVPNPAGWPEGCRFAPRCPMRQPRCEAEDPPANRIAEGRYSRCHFWEQLNP